ncbi:tissue factor pathway inhibitor isoform X2 [Tiliqua scincoides]|uniref:tissue factor pathway inhibitor isoform X2 n=1 Tax=Tiliqua scincoides TaxID=71010 RepID=UPI0034625972
MKMDVFLGTTVYLLFSCVPYHVIASSEGGEELEGPGLPPLRLGHSICAFKADGGPCKAIDMRYHFNIHTRQCEIFEFGGCGGNENNFLTLQECQEKCIVPDFPEKTKRTRLKTGKPPYCLLDNDPGICRGLFSRYFYNKESQQCEKFEYGGCLGNANKFLTLEECQDTCQESLPSVNYLKMDEEEKTPFRELNSSIFSAKQVNSLEVDNGEGALLTVLNDSVPAQKQELTKVPSVCLMPMDRGLCRATEKRFFYNYTIAKCRPFSYSGCGGNENNFVNKKTCLRMCKKDFLKKREQQGIMKIHRKRRKRPLKQKDEESAVEKTQLPFSH